MLPRNVMLESLEPRRLFAAGDLDMAFGGGDGIASFSFMPGSQIDRGNHVAIDSLGRTIVVGTTRANGNFGTPADIVIARFTTAGALDTSFGAGAGYVTRTFLNADSPQDLIVQPDNKILVAFTNASPAQWAVMRLNTDGTNDNSFDGDGVAAYDFGSESIIRLALQPDGKIVSVGMATNFVNPSKAAVVRMTSTGALDSGFGAGGIKTLTFGSGISQLQDVVLDGTKIVAMGLYWETPQSLKKVGVVRLLSDGTPDSNFDGDGQVLVSAATHLNPHSLAVDAASRVLLATQFMTDPSALTVQPLTIRRLTTNGQPDTTFNPAGPTPGQNDLSDVILYTIDPAELMVQSDQKIVFAGAYTDQNSNAFQAARLNPDGTRDTSFAGDGTGKYQPPGSPRVWIGMDATFDANGNIVMSGIDIPDRTNSLDWDLAAMRVQNQIDPPVVITGGVFYVRGTGGADDVDLSIVTGNIRAWVNGAVYTYPANLINSIDVDLGAGADDFSATNDVHLTLTGTDYRFGKLWSFNGAHINMPASSGDKTVVADQLSIDTGSLDLNDADLIVNNAPFAVVQSMVFNGYRAQPDTNATGITSTHGQNLAGTTILSLFNNAMFNVTEWPPGSGKSVAPSAIVGKYTYIGDCDWDGQVTPADYTAIDSNLGTTGLDPGVSWFYGDTDFDGNITPADYTGIDSALGLGAGNPLTALTVRVAVPQPVQRRDDLIDLVS